MRNTGNFKNKKITIVGLARSGLAAAFLLYDLGADVSVTDNRDNALTRLNAAKLSRQKVGIPTLSGKSKDIKFELGRHTEDFIRGRDLVIVSPGVSDESPAIQWAKKFNITLISEIEFAWMLCASPNVIATTGTNGKTTVTTLIGKILQAAGKRVFICGNIGSPFCNELTKIEKGDFVSLEVSSFQLERIQAFKPKIAVILNFSHNHLDRYKDMQEYLNAKKRIFMNQDKADYLVLNSQDPALRELTKEAKSKVLYFSQVNGLNLNQAATLAVGSILGIDKRIILDVFREFKGIEHRLEYVAEINNVKFINDSKSTTVDSTVWALKNISEPVVLISGGRDKGNDYSILMDLARKKVRKIILIGEAKKKIKDVFKGVLAVEEASTLEEAVNIAYSCAKSGDCALLSPMCSSFDMFSDYEERGRRFKKAVYDLTNKY